MLGATLALAAPVAVSAAPATPSKPKPTTTTTTTPSKKAEAFAKLVIKPSSVGHVNVKTAGTSTFKPAKNGQALHVGDSVQTDATGQAEIDYADSAYTRLDVNTTFTIKKLTDAQGNRQVDGSLDVGRTYNRTAALTQSQTFQQDGGGATAAVTGTAFVVTCTSATSCTFTAVIDNIKLTGTDAQTKTLNPLDQCDAKNGALCGTTAHLTPDELALIDWIRTNVYLDLVEHGIGDGIFQPFTNTVVVSAGVVQSPPTDQDLAIGTAPNIGPVAATDADGAPVTFTKPTATDESGENPTVTCDHNSGDTFPRGTTTVTCTATDGDDTNGPVHSTFTVTVTDHDLTMSPAPPDVGPVPATNANGAPVTFTPPTATDEEATTVTCDHNPGDTFPRGTTTVTCTANDVKDTNSPVTRTFNVMVGDADLTMTQPVNVGPVPAANANGAPVVFAKPTATDEEATTVTCDHNPGDTFPVGVTTVTCTATDVLDANSPVTRSFTVTVTDSDLAIATVPNQSAAATSSAGAPVTFTPPTATDESGESPTVTCDHNSGDTFPRGTTTVTCTATDGDDANSPQQSTFTVTVTDGDLTISNPGNQSATATSASGAMVTYSQPTATDDETATVVCNHNSGDTFPVGVTTVTCTATSPDDTNSPQQSTFTVTVTDTDLVIGTAPNIGPVAAVNDSDSAPVTFTPPAATDESGESPTVVCDHSSGATFPEGTTTVTCTATSNDDTPSSVQTSFTVTVATETEEPGDVGG